MTRFDAGKPADIAVWSARAVIADRPGVLFSTVALAGVAIALACGLLLIGRGAQVQLSRTIDAIELSVFLQPQTSRSDAQGLRDRITAIPNVIDARLRTREDALTMLAADGMPALATKSNPLPDVWIVSLGPFAPGLGPGALTKRIADVSASLRALPGVDAVRIDSRWVEWLDRAASRVDGGMATALWVISTTLVLALTALFFLSGRAIHSTERPVHGRSQALATVGMVAGLSALIVAGGMLTAVAALSPELAAIGRPILDSLGRGGHVFVVGMGLAVILAASFGHAVGGSRR